MLKISKHISSTSQNIVKENIESLRILNMNISKLINYSKEMC
jgi:hypothetical protein